MRLVPATVQHLEQMMPWFPDEYRYKQWGGPGLRYPFDRQLLIEDSKLHHLDSYVLLDEQQHLIGFGQYYLRLGRCHFGRLAINPEYRRKSYAMTMIPALADVGIASLNADECSLFVLTENIAAIKLYIRLGFTQVTYPADDVQLEDFWYMTMPSQDLLKWL